MSEPIVDQPTSPEPLTTTEASKPVQNPESQPSTENETQAKIEALKTERSSNLEQSLGDIVPADRKTIKDIDTQLASLNAAPEPTPPYIGKPQGWEAEAPAAAPSLSTATQTQATPEATSPIAQAPEPVASAQKPGIIDKLKGLFVGRKTQRSGI